ncbi:hypothetical protein BCR44DRAFT_1460981 [Catenaria anguillulae PL171]|uniref:Uncharacterized protein n=1 Tax=Catenaria anguillulae PL171 TaxID=765915 RepID=A0A1Y2HM47_9FUNG|nr:hypothetical protein BCR44DRAFT_1460981 [Catenaria anguillulae PL171]
MALSSLSSDALSALVLDPASYTSLVAAHAALTRDPDAFIRLDAELFPGRAAAAASQSQLDLTKEKLMDILKWKLLRGKHRPFLPKLVASNSESAIRAAFSAAMALLTPKPTPASILAATSALSTPLKGVGPATASAVLAAVSPHVPFMSDEIMHSAGVRKPFKYSVKEYEQVLQWVDRQMEAFQAEAVNNFKKMLLITMTIQYNGIGT